jgi:hypothetical protein
VASPARTSSTEELAPPAEARVHRFAAFGKHRVGFGLGASTFDETLAEVALAEAAGLGPSVAFEPQPMAATHDARANARTAGVLKKTLETSARRLGIMVQNDRLVKTFPTFTGGCLSWSSMLKKIGEGHHRRLYFAFDSG